MAKRETFNPNPPRLPERRLTFSPAAKKGNILMLSGLTSRDPKTGETLWKGDIVAQTRQIYQNMKAILEAAGATFDNVVKTVEYLMPDARHNYRGTAAVRREFFGEDNFPAATGVFVNGLVNKDALIEIEAIAILD